MGMDELVARINQEARTEIEGILEDANEVVSSFKSREEERIRKDMDERGKKLQKEILNTRNIHVSDGKRKARQAMLSAKEDLIWETISLIRKRFSEMDAEELSGFLIPMYEKAKGSLGENLKVYPVRRVDRDVLSGYQGILESMEDMGTIPAAISRFGSRDLIGGFVAVASDGRKVVNMSFLGLLEKEEERIRETIARTLFGE
jgi:V/A-type H+-transporting ATPase subunit E